MTAPRLLELFDRVADTPDAVPRLRRLVLDLAVRGRLLPQGRLDAGPAAAWSARANGTVPSGPTESRAPFPLPDTWQWQPFESVAVIETNMVDPRNHRDLPHIAPDNIVSHTGRLLPYETVGSSGVVSGKHLFGPGQILYSKIRPALGKVVVVDFTGLCSADMYPVRPKIDRQYLLRYMLSQPFLAQTTAVANRVAMPKINQDALNRVLVPVPPELEQRRIVAKVDELMALCDRLEAAQKEREAARVRFSAGSLASLSMLSRITTGGASEAPLRLRMSAVAARVQDVSQIRQTVVNLAIRGRLTRRHVTQQVRAVVGGFVEIPSDWTTPRLADLLAEDTRNGYGRKPVDNPPGVPLLRISAGTTRRDGVVAEEEHKFVLTSRSSDLDSYRLQPGDLLACRFNGNKGVVGRLALFTDYLGISPIFPDKLIRVRVSKDRATPEFIRLASWSDIVRADTETHCATTVGNWGISASNLKEVRYPLPPLEEQQRIVAKVNELMALCDQLEAHLKAGDIARSRLLDALIAETLDEAQTQPA